MSFARQSRSKKKRRIFEKFQSLLPYSQCLSLILWANINKIVGITFGVILVYNPKLGALSSALDNHLMLDKFYSGFYYRLFKHTGC